MRSNIKFIHTYIYLRNYLYSCFSSKQENPNQGPRNLSHPINKKLKEEKECHYNFQAFRKKSLSYVVLAE